MITTYHRPQTLDEALTLFISTEHVPTRRRHASFAPDS